ncbi:MAG TPA: aminotransferase class V-fold PLP-dependent enzyme [Gemmatimonadales bacterium]|jgi:selenocysteine lyase/cysteine desulfurase
MDLLAVRQREFAAIEAPGIFLNSASMGPLPARSVAALATANSDRGQPSRWPIERINAILDGARQRSARIIGAAADEIALMPNTTTGLNVAARALPLVAGDVVLTFDGEFPANIYPWLALADRGVLLERLARTPEGWPDEARMHERLADPKVRAITVSLTQFSSGYTVDLAALSRATRAAGKWLVVDAIQSVGQFPIDIQATPVDFLACGAQKWLLSPWGTGFLYVRRALCEQFAPTFAGWAAFTGSDDYTRLTSYNPVPWPDARRFELLTFPVQDFAAMNMSLDLLLDVGVERIADHLRTLHAPVIAAMTESGGRVTSPQGAHGSGILCVRPRGDVTVAYAALQSAGVSCSLREGSIRLSPHLFNTADELARVAALLRSA